MKTVEVAHATESLGQSVQELAGEPLVILERGIPVAALMPIEEADMDSIALGENPKFWAVIEHAREEARQGRGRSIEDVRREFDPS